MRGDEKRAIEVLDKMKAKGEMPRFVRHNVESLNMSVGISKLWPVTHTVLNHIVKLWPYLAEDVSKINPDDEEPYRFKG